jgi:hypothetical protein
MRLRFVLLFCLACIASQAAQAQRTVTGSPHITVPHPATASPEQDCMRAIRRHDFRFVGVAGYALDVPGVPDYHIRYWKRSPDVVGYRSCPAIASR